MEFATLRAWLRGEHHPVQLGTGRLGATGSAPPPSPQDYDAIVSLVETLQALPTCAVAEQHNVRFHYAFALSR